MQQIYSKKYLNKEWVCNRNLKFRQVKLQLRDGSFRSYFNPSKNRLKRLIFRYQPMNVYASISQWLNYKEHNTYPNILLDSDSLIETDEETSERMEQLNGLLLERYPFLGLKHKIQSSEGTHYHYIYETTIKPDLKPSERVEYRTWLKADIVKFAIDNGFKLDEKVCLDIYRVSRMPETVNGNKNGYFSHDCLGTKAGQPPVSRMTSWDIPVPPKDLAGQDNQANLPRPYSIDFISNSVSGTKGLHVPLIRWQKVRANLLRKTIRHYGLGAFLHIQTPKFHYYMPFKAVSSERLMKIYNFSESSSINEFKAYGWNWVIVDGDDNFIVEFEMFDIKGSKGNYSLPHLDFFIRFFEKIGKVELIEKLKLIKKEKITCGKGMLQGYGAEYG